MLGNIFAQLNIKAQCREYGIYLWQCPQFLFLLMGSVIVITIMVSYAIGTRYIADPETVILAVLSLAMILLIIAQIIVQSFERLAEANRLKSEFVSVVSHQLRTPISNLKWATELLMSGRLGSIEPPQTEYFQILKENLTRIGETVADLLIVSKIDTGRLPLKIEKVSVEKAIRDLISLFEPFSKASNVAIQFSCETNVPEILTDSMQVRVIMENLLDNAIRYSQEKGQIEMKLEKKGKNLHFTIRDNGIGIPQTDQKFIFQKFFRSSNVLRYQTRGSGLGLYITKAMVEKLGGRIGFMSQEGKGSTFWVQLPIRY